MTTTASHNEKILPGLVDSRVTIFAHNNDLKCVTDGHTHTYPEFPKRVIECLENDLLNDIVAQKSLADWENLRAEDYLFQFGKCKYGGCSMLPDIDQNGDMNNTEYYECGLRGGQCRFEGKLCSQIKVDNGVLSKAEVETIKLVSFPDKIIADKRNVSVDTITTQMQSIRQKTGLKGKVELAIFANKKGII